MRSRRAALMLSLALLAGSVLAAELPSAGAAVQGCPCVLLIEVDGLEPKDVTRETTPFLWELAHPDEGEQIENTRAGWTWQASRSVMTAGTAANAGALLTGSYPEQAGVPADEFVDPDGTTYRLESNPMDGALQIAGTGYDSESLLMTVPRETEQSGAKQSAAFVGNPALSGIASDVDVDALRWWPTNADPENPPSPAYCDLPRRVPESADYQPPCSATDVVTLNRALNALNGQGASSVALSYIHLAELGVIKRRDGDVSPQAPSAGEGSPEVDSPAAEESLPHALAQVDLALAQFVARYKDPAQSPTTGPKWEDTFVMVVGSHGYETATHARRLPSPDGATDLETYVEADGRLKYSPYGSMATIHAMDDNPEARRQAIESIASKLGQGGPVETACAAMSNGEKCIREVLYVRDDVMSASTAGDAKRLSQEHPHWRFDHLSGEEPFAPTRASGELLVLTEPGWAAGRALPQQQDEGEDGSQLPVSDTPDPYLGVAGGPRNRAVAAIVNGPGGEQGVRQVGPDRYPVTATADTGELDESPQAQFTSLAAANANPEDDTGDAGYERQAENVDFAPTIGALLGVGIESDQLAGRFLQEAFHRPLAFPDLDAPPEEPPPPPPPPPDPPPPPEPEVIILPPPPVPDPPPPPKQWSYSGLVRNLSADVGDRRGRIFPRVRRGAKLSYLILRADFGKPLASVKLSFYRRQTEQGRTSRRRTVVRTLASFDPFSIKRAKRAKLTLKVPKVFKPTHVGVIVRRARRLTGRAAATARRKKLPLFRAYGARKGGIYRIRNARRMHTIAPRKTRSAPRG